MAVRSRQRRTTVSAGGSPELRPGRAFPPQAFDDHDDVNRKVTKSIQDRANRVLKKGKWVVVDGDAGE